MQQDVEPARSRGIDAAQRHACLTRQAAGIFYFSGRGKRREACQQDLGQAGRV
jgi:hypothetical protein